MIWRGPLKQRHVLLGLSWRAVWTIKWPAKMSPNKLIGVICLLLFPLTVFQHIAKCTKAHEYTTWVVATTCRNTAYWTTNQSILTLIFPQKDTQVPQSARQTPNLVKGEKKNDNATHFAMTFSRSLVVLDALLFWMNSFLSSYDNSIQCIQSSMPKNSWVFMQKITHFSSPGHHNKKGKASFFKVACVLSTIMATMPTAWITH